MDKIDYAHLLHFFTLAVELILWSMAFDKMKRLKPTKINYKLKIISPILIFTIIIKASSPFINQHTLVYLLTPYYLMHLFFVMWFIHNYLKNE